MSGEAIHPVAAAGFGADAERYHAGRPGYPAAAVERLLGRLQIGGGALVVDVGAGTGKLTTHLAATDATVVAVEPVAEMAEVLARTAPSVPIIAASAESMPFHEATVDAITCAQAFHWFDAPRAWAEFRRALRPGGGVALIWNARDRSVEWVDAVWSVMDEVEKNAPWKDHDRSELTAGPGFAELRHEQFWHDVAVDRQMMIDRVASVSHVAVLPADERRHVLDRVAAAVPTTPGLTMRYRVDLFTTRRA